jgi:salicylate hydroxylase
MTATFETKDSVFENHATLPIVIVGGGLCGLALAIGLLKHGIYVQIYEAASEFSEIGAGVAFGINSITALKLIDPRLLDGYKKHATFNKDSARANTFYTMRWGTDERREGGHVAGDFAWHLDDIWHPERTQELGVRTRSCIHRAQLLEEFVTLLPKEMIVFGKKFQSAEKQTGGTMKLWFADGTATLAAALIGCDGIKSKVRDLVSPPDVTTAYVGECAYRAVVPKAHAVELLGIDSVLNGHIYCGYGGYIITYPIEHGKLINMVAVTYDKDKPSWSEGEWMMSTDIDEIRMRFEGWYPPLIELISQYHLPHKWALFAVQHDTPYYRNRVCLVGDSAHATVPHLGAGAGMAMEDAFVLSSLIASLDKVADIEQAFRCYDAVRRPRTQECIKRSIEAARGYGMMIPGVGDKVAALKDQLQESFKWLWHEDLEAQLEVAKKLMKSDSE